MKEYFDNIWETVQKELHKIDINDLDISSDEALNMLEFLQKVLSDLRENFLSINFPQLKKKLVFSKK
jgi:hypothetical protein